MLHFPRSSSPFYKTLYMENVICVTCNWGSLPHAYCKRKSCTFPLPSSLTYFLLPTGVKRLFAERVFDFVKVCFTWVTMYPGFRRQSSAICAWFRASAAVKMRSSLFWDVTQRRLVVTGVSGRLTSHTFKDQAVLGLQTLEDVTDMLSRNVGNYQSTLGDIPQQARPDII